MYFAEHYGYGQYQNDSQQNKSVSSMFGTKQSLPGRSIRHFRTKNEAQEKKTNHEKNSYDEKCDKHELDADLNGIPYW